MVQANDIDGDFASKSRLPLAFLPGTLCDSRIFAPVIERLNTRGRTIVHASFDGARSVDEAVAALCATLPTKAIVIGFSLGGIVAMALARAAPERVMALVLIGSTARPVDRAQHDRRRSDAEQVRSVGLAAHVRARLSGYLAEPDDPEHADAIVAMAETAGAARLVDQTEIAISRADARSWLRRITVPVLVTAGVQDTINPPEVQAEIADALPDATLVLIERAGHFTPIEQPEILAAHIAAWLGQVDAHHDLPTKEIQR